MVLIIHYLSSSPQKAFGLFARLEFTRGIKCITNKEVPKNCSRLRGKDFYFNFSFFLKDILWIVSKEEFQKGIKPMQLHWNNDTIQGNEALNIFWTLSVLTGKSDCFISLSAAIYLGRKETTRINYKTILKRFESQG